MKTKGRFKVYYMQKYLKFFSIIGIIIISILSSTDFAHASPLIPERIRVGLNYNSLGSDISISSNSPVTLNILDMENKFKSIQAPSKLSIRIDGYYNIINKEVKNIQYIKAVKYQGDIIGPYHIQIGNSYKDYDSAEKLLKEIRLKIPNSYLAYDRDWKVWNGLYLDEKQCLEKIKELYNKNQSYTYNLVEPDPKRVQIVDYNDSSILMIYKNKEIVIKNSDISNNSNILEFNGIKYRGDIVIRTQENGSISVINDIMFDEYLYSVVGSEVSPTWHIEALKAQAVAARNYAIINIEKHSKDGYDLCNTQHCQAYKGYSKEQESTNLAVAQTNNILLYYDNKLATTFYHSSSGGHTENSENIWSEEIPYLRGVEDPFSYGSPNDTWTKELDRKTIEEKLVENKIDIGEILDINIIETSEFGRAKKIEIIGSKSKFILEKEKIRSIFGSTNIKSIWYEIKTDSDVNVYDMNANSIDTKKLQNLNIISATGQSLIKPSNNKISIKGLFEVQQYNIIPETYVLNGKGWGHGLGMSQYGAKGMADMGYNFVEILEYYYTGTKVK